MTKEELTICKMYLEDLDITHDCNEYKLLMGLLEQQSSDDCVSRQTVLDKIKEVCFSEEWVQFRVNKGSNGQRDFLINYIEQLPSVTPTHKSGLHWIERFDNESMWLECPHCHMDSMAAYNYCPNCGANFKEEKGGNSDDSN